MVDDGCGGSYTCDARPPAPTAKPDLLAPGAACFQLVDLANCHAGGALELDADIHFQVAERNENDHSAPPLTLY